jgi:release factor glutamine methyltransferase
MITKRELLLDAVAKLEAAGVDSARTDARVLLSHALGIPADELLGVECIDAPGRQAFERLLSRRTAREPLAYITGLKEFFSVDFEVGPGVLIPRPETETLIEEALKSFPDRSVALHVLDYGTGSGCLIIAFLLQYPNAWGLGIDISNEALAWAERNASRHGLTGRAVLANDVRNARGEFFDVVLANPPYLTESEFGRAAPEITHYEPKAAFVGGDDGLASYSALARLLMEKLAPQGLAFVEVGVDQASPVARLFADKGLEVGRSVPDLQGIVRCVVVGRQRRGGAEP